MTQRQAVFAQWEKEMDTGRDMNAPRIFGGPLKLLLEESTGEYFNIPMSDPSPGENDTPLQAGDVFGMGVEVDSYTRDTNFLEAPTGTETTTANVGDKVHLLGGRMSSDKKAGKRVIVPTQVPYQATRTRPDGTEEQITKYKVKSFTFPAFFNVTMIRQLIGQMLRRRFPHYIKIEGTQYPFVQFPLERQRFTPRGTPQASSGAWIVESETAMRQRPATTQEEYWNTVHRSVAEGIPI